MFDFVNTSINDLILTHLPKKLYKYESIKSKNKTTIYNYSYILDDIKEQLDLLIEKSNDKSIYKELTNIISLQDSIKSYNISKNDYKAWTIIADEFKGICIEYIVSGICNNRLQLKPNGIYIGYLADDEDIIRANGYAVNNKIPFFMSYPNDTNSILSTLIADYTL